MAPAAEEPSRPLRLAPAERGRARADFLRVPWALYADDPAWVPPLLLERRLQLSRRRPYFAHARAAFWVAYRGTRAVGRISAQVDRLHLERHQDGAGFFGLLEAEDDAEVFAALLSRAEAWVRDQGLSRVRGPFDLSINEECGLLVDGFGTPPMIMMRHGRPYYAARLEACHYRPVKDLLAYRLTAEAQMAPVMRAAVARLEDVRVRPLRRSRLREDLGILRDIFEDAWADNWGFVPFTAAEFEELGWVLRFVVDDDFVQIAEVAGAPAAMLVLLPNVNELIRDLDGRLLPLGWARLLARLMRRRPRTGRVALMGVRKRYQRTPLGLGLACLVIDTVRRAGLAVGLEEVELSWILEDNLGVRRILEALGGDPYKRYRIYDKALV
ncbi:MAG TPA: N-acetyltransferase [Methylomirabilota bacterium]|nr:N-acetyltransferase [Methylomirabilota bacterium]